MEEDLISIIVPIYNVEKYINKCVNSIICQTYKNLEIILVDDGSPDNCPQICDEYAKKNERIKVIHKKNGGLSDARNIGIDNAKGKYISFVDSDDYIESNYIEVLYNTLKKYNVKMSIADNLIIYEDGTTINNSTYKEYVVSAEKEFEQMLWAERDLDNGAWTKLYDSSLFKEIRYPVGELYEDTATTYKLFEQCDLIAINSVPIYNYMKRRDSITQCEFNEKKLQLIDATKEMTDYVRTKYPNLKEACDRKLLWAYFSTLSQLVASKYRNKKIERKLLDYIKTHKKKVFLYKNTPRRDKIGIICVSFGFNFYKFVWRLYLKINKKY